MTYQFALYQTVEVDNLQILTAGWFLPSIFVNNLALTPPQIRPPFPIAPQARRHLAPAAIGETPITKGTEIYTCQLSLLLTFRVFPPPHTFNCAFTSCGVYLPRGSAIST